MSDLKIGDEVWIKPKFKILEIDLEKGTALCEAKGENGPLKIECSLNDIEEDSPPLGFMA
ncbi:hypothetical protein MOW08_06710 [Acinetobacter schindleri]|uniref:hypothetical protein n=1 Tax=Acinetobacter sp. Brlt_5 TaxID=3110915 RepID=UPI00204DDDCD|nr:hypothetical protein MOW08_06710 [Acinetobacter schindleri]